MAPSARPSSKTGLEGDEDEDYWVQKGDRKTRKPLVEKKRRARINESLLELRTLLADTDFHNKMENAEVLEMTVMKVEDILKNRTQETDAQNRESSERFAAGYIQCMHEVHMFVSSCPGIDATVAAELLNHLLECMPLNEDHFQDVLMDLMTDTNTSSGQNLHHGGSTWSAGEALCSALASPGGRSTCGSSSSSTVSSGEDLSCSDMDDTESEHNQSSCSSSTSSTDRDSPSIMPSMIASSSSSQSMWRPW